ncbi:MAG: hypothetical protein RLZZ142_150 [Verrucomicrobiota bacterium]|jgi:DNA-binding response OmpR family regulator
MKILVAEDDAVSAKILQLSLEREGHEVFLVRDGKEAWAHLKRDPVSVVLSDWKMPDLDGLELCRRIRREAGGEYPYFILLTGMAPGLENIRAAMAAGVDDFLSKPLDREVLCMRLGVAARILDYHRQIRDLRSLLPICMYCSRIRDEGSRWQPVECYLAEHSGSRISHGVCPECFAREHGSLPKPRV